MPVESRAHPPLIPSQLSAKLRAEQWNSSHKSELVDGDGLNWQLHLVKGQAPDLASLRDLEWQITLQLRTQASVEALIATGTLDPASDARLIAMLTGHSIPLAMRPLVVTSRQEEEAHRLASEALSDYAGKLERADLKAIKRKLIGRYIDEKLQFRLPDYD